MNVISDIPETFEVHIINDLDIQLRNIDIDV